MKKLFLTAAVLVAGCITAMAQLTCNPAGNVVLFTNYDGGTLNINVDVNIPNLKIGIVSYEAVSVNLSGAFVGNVTAVRYAGYNATSNTNCSPNVTATAISGAPVGATTNVVSMPASPVSNSNGYPNIICAYSCSTTTNQGGCNTVDQVEAYFLAQFTGGSIRFHKVQYGCWSGTQALSSAGNCCLTVAPPTPLSVVSAPIAPTCFGGCNGTAGVTVTGGTPPYTYQWTGGPATATWGNRCAGSYTVVVGHAGSGTVSQIVNVTQPVQKASSFSQTACNGYFFNGAERTATGAYTDTLTAANGCDSIVTLNLTVNTLNVNVNQSNATLTAALAGAAYKWYNCDSNKLVPNATGQSYTATRNGRYAAIITQNGCTDTSACKTVNSLSVGNAATAAAWKVYPNPATHSLTVELPAGIPSTEYRITDALGRVVLKGKVAGGITSLNITSLKAGIYTVAVGGSSLREKFVKE